MLVIAFLLECLSFATASQPNVAKSFVQLLRKESRRNGCCSVGQYQASLLEQQTNPLTGTAGCKEDMAALAEIWVNEISSNTVNDTRVFSQICVPGHCEPQLLEPLAWNMKDPRLRCGNIPAWSHWRKDFEEAHNQLSFLSKEFIALPPASNAKMDQRVLLYDLGASLYGNGCTWGLNCKKNGEREGWGTSGKWFVDEYGKHGFTFSHLYLWEMRFNESQYRASGLPDELADKITFYHGPVNTTDEAPFNPLNVLRGTCSKDDYCVLKVDFDSEKDEYKVVRTVAGEPSVNYTGSAEKSFLLGQQRTKTAAVKFVEALLENKDGILDLVDEIFMDGPTPDEKLDYKLLLKLRQSSVRAHMWV